MRKIIIVLLVLLSLIVCAVILFLVFSKDAHYDKHKTLPLPTIRQTLHGPVEGIEETTVLGQKYYAFRGIPYAAPPITGIDPYTRKAVDRRFKAPEPLNYSWNETLKVHKFRDLCQSTEVLPEFYQNYTFSEDCLFVNLYVPAGGVKRKTVLVYIHGAGIDGGARLDTLLEPDFLLSQDNIVVHLEYRVLLFGFLNLGFGEYTGNMGLKDQQLGLKWIYENIEFFSGMKDEIMIFGGSAGAAYVHAHTLNQNSLKYFTRAFISSGSLSFWNSPYHVKRIQDCLEIEEMSNDELVNYLKTVNTSTLTKCNGTDWLMTIESSNAVRPFLPKRTKEIFASDNPPIVDVLFVVASLESIQVYPQLLDEITIPWLDIEPFTLPFKGFTESAYPKEYKQAIDILRRAYFSNSFTIDAIRRANIEFQSDLIMYQNILKAVMYQAQANANNFNGTENGGQRQRNTFLLRYSMHTDLNVLDTKEKMNYTGAAHSDDLCYYFYCRFESIRGLYEKHLKNKDKAYELIMRWVKMITNFARFGDPSIEGDTPFKSCKSFDEIYCQEISNHPKSHVTTNIKQQFHYDAWNEINEIYLKLGIPPISH